ncbi:hypothetical protein PV327_005132 [Microctonus hyperodae]|uniref:F-box domain-containing protein n=1 Tax=Microctonus hyperodae TaxID=165561 RepID=A0AA39G267_MICHY|nr:hypothetical protein PV327_005132 [Microctonus hyperodae]
MAEIEILNQDVLMEIFSYLNIHDRQSMGLVCKKWQAIYEIMLKSIHEMCCKVSSDIEHKLFVEIQNNVLVLHTHERVHIEKPLKKFANNLKKIIIWDLRESDDLPPDFYGLLTKYQNLSFTHFDCHYSQSIEKLLKFLPTDNQEDLSIIFIDRYSDVTEHDLDDVDVLGEMTKKVLTQTKFKFLIIDSLQFSDISWFEGMSTLTKMFIRFKELDLFSLHWSELNPNIEIITIFKDELDDYRIVKELRKIFRKHTIQFNSEDVSSETTLNEMLSLPNLRFLSFYTCSETFSNLEIIPFEQPESYSAIKDQIKSFVQRSRILETYYISCSKLNETVHKVASDIGHKCKMGDLIEIYGWTDVTPF